MRHSSSILDPDGHLVDVDEQLIPMYAGPVFYAPANYPVSVVMGANFCLNAYTATADYGDTLISVTEVPIGLLLPLEARFTVGPSGGAKMLMSIGTGFQFLFWEETTNYMIPIEAKMGISF